ncbi:MAG TPA: hypothetical protein VMF61_02150 [Candidatus Acidoferrales bacterium]|nr:hypothetical protein [Candidatus Acidoferrales bacterium]
MRIFFRIAAPGVAILAFLFVLRVAGDAAPTGTMAMYGNLPGAPWTCSLGGATYSAVYSAVPGSNTLHGHLYSKGSSEDEYLGYDPKLKLYWIVSADSNGATESQTSRDGVTFTGTLNDGGATTKAANTYTMSGAHKWTVRARGTAGGQPYDVLATCVRN